MGKRHSGKRRPDRQELLAKEAVLRHIDELKRPGGLLQDDEVERVDSYHLQDVWGGLGTVSEVAVRQPGADERLFIVKHVQLGDCHTAGDVRKRDSYHVEANFYESGHAAALRKAGAVCPQLAFVERDADRSDLVLCISRLEGMPARRLSPAQTDAALLWLARLHATYWGQRADAAVEKGGLQPQGSYWYLDTRPEEHKRMPTDGWQGRLRLAAKGIDERLKADPCQAVVHGDAKSENMIFVSGGGSVSVGFFDFQYTGKAHPAKDLAYCLLGLDEDHGAGAETKYLDRYLAHLTPLLEAQGDAPPTLQQLRVAYGLCMCDFARFMSGWGFCGFESTLRRHCKATLDAIDGGRLLGSEEAYTEAVFRAFPV